jgi:hypothetical protein
MQKEIKAADMDNMPGSNGVDTDTVSIEAVRTQLRGEWVLMRVTRFDESRDPTHGRVVAHSFDEEEVSKALPPRPEPPAPSDGPYYMFRAEPRIRSGPEFEQAAQELIDQFNSRREARRRGMA